MPAASVVIPGGALRFARAPRPRLLPATTQKAQISAGLSFCLDEKRGSRHQPWRVTEIAYLVAQLRLDNLQFVAVEIPGQLEALVGVLARPQAGPTAFQAASGQGVGFLNQPRH